VRNFSKESGGTFAWRTRRKCILHGMPSYKVMGALEKAQQSPEGLVVGNALNREPRKHRKMEWACYRSRYSQRVGSKVEGSDRCRWRTAITKGGKRSQPAGEVEPESGGGKRPQVEGSDRRWREAIAGGGKRSQVEGSDCRWRGATAGGGGDRRLR
jgi:hypothetical protein